MTKTKTKTVDGTELCKCDVDPIEGAILLNGKKVRYYKCPDCGFFIYHASDLQKAVYQDTPSGEHKVGIVKGKQREMTNLYTVITRLLDILLNNLTVLGGLLMWMAAGCLIYLVSKTVVMATGLVETIAVGALAVFVVGLIALPFIFFGYFLILMGIKATLWKVLEQKTYETNNAYLVHSTTLDKTNHEPMMDIFIASDRIKAEELFLRDFPNATETQTKLELIASDVERVEGVLKFDLEDELYWELWELVGDEKILKIGEEATANTEC